MRHHALWLLPIDRSLSPLFFLVRQCTDPGLWEDAARLAGRVSLGGLRPEAGHQQTQLSYWPGLRFCSPSRCLDSGSPQHAALWLAVSNPLSSMNSMRVASTSWTFLVNYFHLAPRCDGPRFHWTIFIFDPDGDENGSG